MSATQLRSLLRSLVYVTVMAVPLIFWRSVADAFDLVKGTTLAILSLAVGLVLAMLAIIDRKHIAPRHTLIAAGVFTLAAVLATVTSMDPLQSVIGQYQRYTGLVTLLGAVIVMLAIAAAFSVRNLITLAQVLVVTATGVALYGFIQEIQADPFQWTSESFGKFVFGTMGNPNTGTAFVSVVSPLTAWAMVRREHSPAVRALAGMAFGGAIGMTAGFHSLQGYAAVGFAVLYLAARAWMNGRTTGRWLIAGLAGVFLAFILTQEYTSTLWLLILAYAGVFAAIGASIQKVEAITLPPTLYNARKALGGVAVVLVLALAAVFGNRVLDLIQRELSGSLVERGDFYRAGWKVFLDNPVFGSGLETFGHVFTVYRPEGHAIRLEGSRTSSVHSIQLGMFSNGGLVLGIAYMAIVVMVIWVGVRALRRDRSIGSGALMAALFAYMGFQVQSSVSVEHVGLHLVHFTLAGLVLAFAHPMVDGGSVVTKGSKRKYGKGQRTTLIPTPAIIGAVIIWIVVSAFVTTRPIRAAMASFTGVQAATQLQDINTGVQELNKAISRAPWEGLWWTQRAEMKSFQGDTLGAAEDASEAASRLMYKSGSGVALARIISTHAQSLVNSGDAAGADDWWERSLEIVRLAAANDPLAPQVNANTAEYMASVADLYRQLGREQEARDLLAEAATYQADNATVAQVLDLLDNPPVPEEASDGGSEGDDSGNGD